MTFSGVIVDFKQGSYGWVCSWVCYLNIFLPVFSSKIKYEFQNKVAILEQLKMPMTFLSMSSQIMSGLIVNDFI